MGFETHVSLTTVISNNTYSIRFTYFYMNLMDLYLTHFDLAFASYSNSCNISYIFRFKPIYIILIMSY